MTKVLKNYKNTGEFVDGDYPLIKIRDDEDVFVDLPLCALEYNRVYKEPVLLMEPNKVPTVIEKSELLVKLSKLKKFYFLVDANTGDVQEVDPDQSNLAVRLPTNTPVENLIFEKGELILVEQVEEEVNN